MYTLLVISRQSSFAGSIQAAIDPARYRVIAKEDVGSAGSLLARNAIDAVILDPEHTGGSAIRAIEKVRALSPHCPLIVFAAPGSHSWEEEAYLLGVAHVLDKPVRARLLVNLLDRSLDGKREQDPLGAPDLA